MPRPIIDTESSRPRVIGRRLTALAVLILLFLVALFLGFEHARNTPHPVPARKVGASIEPGGS